MVTIETIRPSGPVKHAAPQQRLRSADRLHLEHFVPYRLSVLTNIVSMSIADAYEREFGLTIPQWRVIAVLARYPDLSAIEVAERTAMDKVAVSRAVQGLLAARGWCAPTTPGDRRRSHPAAVERRPICIHARRAAGTAATRSSCSDALSPTDRRALDRLLGRLIERAKRAWPTQRCRTPL